jgi:catechol 2,3-dioxygenase-like lactoylglutathione lyase family enzyme
MKKPELKKEFASGTIGIGMVVSDLERSLDFYTSVIGMTVVSEFDIDETFSRVSGLTGGIPFHVHVLKLDDRPPATSWKLISFGKEAARPLPEHIQDDTGMRYITLQVKRLQPLLERIREHGVELLGETPVPFDDKRHFALVRDPDGIMIELIGPLK